MQRLSTRKLNRFLKGYCIEDIEKDTNYISYTLLPDNENGKTLFITVNKDYSLTLELIPYQDEEEKTISQEYYLTAEDVNALALDGLQEFFN